MVFSAIMIVGALVLPDISSGMIEASTTQSLDAAQPQALTDHGERIVAHSAGRGRMIGSRPGLAAEHNQVLIARDIGSRIDLGNGMKWIWMSGVARRGLFLKKAPACPRQSSARPWGRSPGRLSDKREGVPGLSECSCEFRYVGIPVIWRRRDAQTLRPTGNSRIVDRLDIDGVAL